MSDPWDDSNDEGDEAAGLVPVDDEYDGEDLPPLDEAMVFEIAIAEPEPFSIAIDFKTQDGSMARELFGCVGAEPAGAILSRASMVRYVRQPNGQMARAYDLEGMSAFFERVMLPASYARFTAMLNDQERIVEMRELGKVFEGLIGRYAGRPTLPSSGSRAGRRDAGKRSKGKRS